MMHYILRGTLGTQRTYDTAEKKQFVRILHEEKPQQGRPIISQDANKTFVSEKWQKVNCVPWPERASFKKPHYVKL